MTEMHDCGLCYYCDDKWASGHRCRATKLFLLEGLEQDGEEEVFKEVSNEPEMGEL